MTAGTALLETSATSASTTVGANLPEGPLPLPKLARSVQIIFARLAVKVKRAVVLVKASIEAKAAVEHEAPYERTLCGSRGT